MGTTDIVLIIEVNRGICFFLEQILTMVGFEASCAETLKDSDCLLQRISPNSVFVDNNLPDGSGFEYISKIKEYHPNTKVIAMTANLSPEAKNEAITNGADHYLEKPFTVDQVINALLGRKTIGLAFFSPN